MPLTLYSIHETRKLMEDETTHAYDIEAVRKAAKQGTLICLWVGDEPLFTKRNIVDYLWRYGRYKPKSVTPTNDEE